jgi:hypothetical protein
MTNDEIRMANQTASPNDEPGGAALGKPRGDGPHFGIAVSSFIRHSGFEIRHCSLANSSKFCRTCLKKYGPI